MAVSAKQCVAWNSGICSLFLLLEDILPRAVTSVVTVSSTVQLIRRLLERGVAEYPLERTFLVACLVLCSKLLDYESLSIGHVLGRCTNMVVADKWQREIMTAVNFDLFGDPRMLSTTALVEADWWQSTSLSAVVQERCARWHVLCDALSSQAGGRGPNTSYVGKFGWFSLAQAARTSAAFQSGEVSPCGFTAQEQQILCAKKRLMQEWLQCSSPRRWIELYEK